MTAMTSWAEANQRLEREEPAASVDTLVAIDFFCGAGGMTRGLFDAGIEVLAGVDVEPDCRETYNANFYGRAKFVERDVRVIQRDDVLRLLGKQHELDNLVMVGCSPCQYWSKVNTSRERSKASRTLLAEFGRLVEVVRPGWVIVENVPGLARCEGGQVLETFLVQLEAAGLQAIAHGRVRASDHGVPQKRERFLLIASRQVDHVTLPPASEEPAPTIRETIGRGLTRLAAGEACPADDLHRAARLSESNLRRIQMTPTNGGSRIAWQGTDLQIPAYIGKPGQFTDVYGRMRWDEPGPTITTRFNSLSNGRFGHPEQHRALTAREGALLQTFPRSHVFKGSIRSVCRQIGNAVPPRLAAAIATHLYRLRAAQHGA